MKLPPITEHFAFSEQSPRFFMNGDGTTQATFCDICTAAGPTRFIADREAQTK